MGDHEEPIDRTTADPDIQGQEPLHSTSSALSAPSSAAPSSTSGASQNSAVTSVKRRRSQAHHDSYKRPKQRSKLKSSSSPLDRLPTELLQAIFLHCHEPALPECSPRIGAKLSSRHVLVEYSLRTLQLSPAPLEHLRFSKKDGRPTHQSLKKEQMNVNKKKSQLLRLRFFTWRFFIEILRIANRRYTPLNDELFIFTDCDLPAKILHGPWTPSKIDFLEFITSSGCRVMDVFHTTSIAAKKGIYDAIEQRVFAPLATLLSCSFKYEWEYINYWDCCAHLVQPSIDMVHSAVFDHGCSIGTVCLLLIHGLRVRDFEYLDSQLWIWTETAGAKGVWLVWLLSNLWRVKNVAYLGDYDDAARARRITQRYPDVLRLDGMGDFEPDVIVDRVRSEFSGLLDMVIKDIRRHVSQAMPQRRTV